MTKEDIDKIIGKNDIYAIEYTNLSWNTNIRHIDQVSYLPKNKSCIRAYCFESNSFLIFSISRINNIQTIWTYITNENETVPQDGLYIFACRDDNHMSYEPAHMKQGERFMKYFEGEYKHGNICFTIYPQYYHYIPYSITAYKKYHPDNPASEYRNNKLKNWYNLVVVTTMKGEMDSNEYVLLTNTFSKNAIQLHADNKIDYLQKEEKELFNDLSSESNAELYYHLIRPRLI